MRNLLLLVGPSGSGKSTFVKENNLERNTLSYDSLRALYCSESYDSSENRGLPKDLPKACREFYLQSINNRMGSGDFLVIDNLNLDRLEIKLFKELSKTYGYKVYYKRFKDLKTANLALRTANRGFNPISETAIKKQVEKLKSWDKLIPSHFTEINEISDIPDLKLFSKPLDFTDTEVVIIGDIHGCYNELKKFFDTEYSTDKFYIFCGDYLDRGYDSKGTLRLLREYLYDRKNVILLEGNHEKWLRYYSIGKLDLIRNTGFKRDTLREFREKDDVYRLSEAKNVLNRLKMASYVKTKAGTVLVTHGGVLNIENKSSSSYKLKSADSYIKGSGKYQEISKFYKQDSDDADFIVHGHRNSGNLPHRIHSSDSGNTKFINLEGGVEKGGSLRYCIFKTDGKVELKEIKGSYDYRNDVQRLVKDFRENKDLIRESDTSCNNIKSFNFTNDVFFDKIWNELSCKARGLFIDVDKFKVVGRGYHKFFNLFENDYTSEVSLKNLNYPIKTYKKSNGFLGIVYERGGELIFNSKAGDLTDSALEFKNIFEELISEENRKAILDIIKNFNISLCFEVITPNRENLVNFSKESRLVLLDAIKNQVEFEKWSYKNLKATFPFITNPGKVEIKSSGREISSFDDLKDFIEENKFVTHEGFVLEDSSGFMCKLKLPVYGLKKSLRTLFHTGSLSNFMSSLNTKKYFKKEILSRELALELGNKIIEKSNKGESLGDLSFIDNIFKK